MPVYLDDEVETFFVDRARAKGVVVPALVDCLLRKDIEPRIQPTLEKMLAAFDPTKQGER